MVFVNLNGEIVIGFGFIGDVFFFCFILFVIGVDEFDVEVGVEDGGDKFVFEYEVVMND